MDTKYLLSTIASYGHPFLLFVIKASVVLILWLIAFWISKRLTHWFSSLLTHTHIDPILNRFLRRLLFTLLIIFISLIALDRLGIKTYSMVAVISAIAVTLGLALKDSVSNIASGIMLIVFRPFKLNDLITTGSLTGYVEDIALFTTSLKTTDGRLAIIPNKTITSEIIINNNNYPLRKISIILKLIYHNDLNLTKNLLCDVLTQNMYVLKQPSYSVTLTDLTGSNMTLEINAWVNRQDYSLAQNQLLKQIKYNFDEHQVSLS